VSCSAYGEWTRYGLGMWLMFRGEVLDEADEHPTTIFADIDTELLATTRRNLPVTIQRRFGVYPDVSK
jgi:omega-amidase